MTANDKPAFAQAFARLAVAFPEKVDAVDVTVYLNGLIQHEIEFVIAAAELLIRGSWFPKVGIWHQQAAKVELERIAEQRALLARRDSPQCEKCSDTSWALVDGRVHPCECRQIRRLEVLGRRPALPDQRQVPDATTPDRTTRCR
jgi:hypothetical protein